MGLEPVLPLQTFHLKGTGSRIVRRASQHIPGPGALGVRSDSAKEGLCPDLPAAST